MARQRDYVAEYARRMAPQRAREARDLASGRRDKPDYEARAEARGQRGESAFLRMAPGSDSVHVYGNLTEDGKAFARIHKHGKDHHFTLYKGKPLTEAQAQGRIERWRDAIAGVPDAQVNISP